MERHLWTKTPHEKLTWKHQLETLLIRNKTEFLKLTYFAYLCYQHINKINAFCATRSKARFALWTNEWDPRPRMKTMTRRDRWTRTPNIFDRGHGHVFVKSRTRADKSRTRIWIFFWNHRHGYRHENFWDRGHRHQFFEKLRTRADKLPTRTWVFENAVTDAITNMKTFEIADTDMDFKKHFTFAGSKI